MCNKYTNDIILNIKSLQIENNCYRKIIPKISEKIALKLYRNNQRKMVGRIVHRTIFCGKFLAHRFV